MRESWIAATPRAQSALAEGCALMQAAYADAINTLALHSAVVCRRRVPLVRHRVAPATMLLSTLLASLVLYAGSRQLLVGSIAATRPPPAHASLAGCCARCATARQRCGDSRPRRPRTQV